MSNNKTRDYKDIIVWKKSVELSVLVYTLTKDFPKCEIFGLTNQMRRCSVSIPSNIAEGSGRQSFSKDQRYFFLIAYGSAQELETQLFISKQLEFISESDYKEVQDLLTEVLKMLYTMVYK